MSLKKAVEDAKNDIKLWEFAQQLQGEFPRSVKVTTTKPVTSPPKIIGSVCEGIEPVFNDRYLEHAKARKVAYKKTQEAFLDELCEGIGSVATGRDNPPRKKKVKPVLRSIDETWEGG